MNLLQYCHEKIMYYSGISIRPAALFPHQQRRKKTAETILFVGDSITEQFPVHQYFKEYKTINKGVYDERSARTLERTRSFSKTYEPDYAVLLIGTNDLYSQYAFETILENICGITEELSSIKSVRYVFVQSIYPINTELRGGLPMQNNESISEFTLLLEETIKQYKKAVYVDMYSQLIDENGMLNIEYTTDGLHISARGYEVITSHLTELIEEYDSKKSD